VAAGLCERLLESTPHCFEALHLLGVIAVQQGNAAQGIPLLEQAIVLRPSDVEARSNLGYAYRSAGQPAKALAQYQEAIRLRPQAAESWYSAANALLALEQYEAALTHYEAALQRREHYPEAWLNRGQALKALGQLPAALASVQQSLAQRPQSAIAYLNLGLIQHDLKDYDAALASYDTALHLNPRYAKVLNNRCVTLKAMGRDQDALTACQQALALQPDYPEALCNQGNILNALERTTAALASYEAALQREPTHRAALCGKALSLNKLERIAEGLACCDTVLALQPDHAEAWDIRGELLRHDGQADAAIACYRQAISHRPDFAEAYCHLGFVQYEQGQREAALTSYRQALALQEDYAEAWLNTAILHKALGQLDEAATCCQTVMRLNATRPDRRSQQQATEARFFYGIVQLLQGRLPQGWPDYEARWQLPNFRSQKRQFSQPLWDGSQPLAGKRILLHAEQGLGDTLQFCRYAAVLAAQGATVLLEVQSALIPVLRGLAGVAELLPYPQGSNATFDYYCPLLSLPLALGTTLDSIPDPGPYLFADPERQQRWQQRFAAHFATCTDALSPQTSADCPKIGLVWSGNPKHKNDHNRSLALADLLTEGFGDPRHPGQLLPGIHWISLQKEVRDSDQAALAATPQVQDWGKDLADFADTAAVISGLDLVISVDTSVAHLAGALGKPVWLLLPYMPDWRWLLARTDSPWYRSLRLFRQTAPADWSAVFAALQAALQQFNPAPALPITATVTPDHSNRTPPARAMPTLTALLPQVPQPTATESPEHWYRQGNSALNRQQFVEALRCYDQAIALRSHYPQAWINRGLAFNGLKLPQEAEASLKQAIALDPGLARAYLNLGLLYHEQGNYPQALDSYTQALACKPDYPEACNNQGVTLQLCQRYPEALASYDAAIRLRPNYASAHANRGVVLHELERFAEAVAACDQAIASQPESADAWYNRGTSLQAQGQIEAALYSYSQAIRFGQLQKAHWNQSLLQLMQGNFAEGWKNYEARWKKSDFEPPRPFDPQTQPLWLGQTDLQGKTILLHAEQGLGDALQFCRFAASVKALGATVLLEIPLVLHDLLANLDGVDQLLVRGAPLPNFDYHCPLLSLPHALGLTLEAIPAAGGYLQAPASAQHYWQEKLGPRKAGTPWIGLVWSGNPLHKNDHHRSLPLAALLDLLPQAGVELFCLQKEIRPDDQALLAAHPAGSQIRFVGDELRNFADTAGLVATVDLVISVDTSVAHLAGALGKPLWVLLPFVPDWRWLLGRGDSPWYRHARLFRQPAYRDWPGLFAQLRQTLQGWLAQQGWEGELPALSVTVAEIPLQASPRLTKAAIDTLYQEAKAAQQSGNLADAEASYARILATQPDHADALHLSGVLCYQQGKLADGVARIQQAVAVKPDYPAAHFNLGYGLRQLRQYQAALHHLQEAVRQRPDYLEALSNLGFVQRDLGLFAEAESSYRQALALSPEFVQAQWNLALLQLLQGNLAEGFANYECRWRWSEFPSPRRYTTAPRWHGNEDLHGKTILLHAEQGLGDTLHFCRYASLVKARGAAKVILQVPASLRTLLTPLEGVDDCLDFDAPPPAFDYQIPLMSLPLAFGTTLANIPAPIPYLYAPATQAASWANRLGPKTRPRIGIAWSGNPNNANDEKRTLTLAELLDALPPGLTEQVELVSLQQEIRPADQLTLTRHPEIRHFGHELKDFGDTAALVEQLDLVISICTSVAHLAGGMGKPLWLLLAHRACWRWLQVRSDSPWYPTARLLRQLALDDWAGALQGLSPALHDWLAQQEQIQTQAQPLPTNPTNPTEANREAAETHFRQALALQQQGQLEAAQAACEQAVALNPQHFDAVHLCALQHLQHGHFSDGIARLQQALALQPEHPDALANLAKALQRQGETAPALAALEQLLRVQPDNLAHWKSAMSLLVAAERWTTMLEWCDRAEAGPLPLLEIRQAKAVALNRLKRHQDAKACLEPLLADHPDSLPLLNDYAQTCLAGDALETAIPALERLNALAPHNKDTLSLLAATENRLNRPDKATQYLETLLQTAPESSQHWNYLGIMQLRQCRPDLAQPALEHALQLDPANSEAGWNLSLVQLLQGQFAEGWRNYERRWQWKDFPAIRRNFSPPLWLGQTPLAGKTILLHAEQGLGDALQFCRYAPLVKALGATVLLEVHPPLKPLLQSLHGVDQLLAYGETLPAFDLHCPLLSLPHALANTGSVAADTIPASVPYLRASPQKHAHWQTLLQQRLGIPGAPSRPRLGLVWSGNPQYKSDKDRSLPLPLLLAALPAGRFDLICLQKDIRPEDRETVRQAGIHDFSAELQDFADTAALVGAMDLVISVDTSVAHLAGALGKPLWVLLPRVPDWRWLLHRTDSDWYPSTRLFRQQALGDWSAAFAALKTALAGFTLPPSAPQPPSPPTPPGKPAAPVKALTGKLRLQPCRKAAAAQPVEAPAPIATPPETSASTPEASTPAQPASNTALKTEAEAKIRAADWAGAETLLHTLHQLEPDNVSICAQLADALIKQYKVEPGLALLQTITRLTPNDAQAWSTLAGMQVQARQFDAAERNFKHAIHLAPTLGDPYWNLGQLQLLRGNFTEGWSHYEHRWAWKPKRARQFASPLWLGESGVAGKTLLIYAEQGFGDTLQFCRYVRHVKALGATVLLEVQAELKPLLTGLEGVDHLLARGEPLPAFDLHCPLLSLPLALTHALGQQIPTDLPPQAPYLQAPADKQQQWENRLAQSIAAQPGSSPRQRKPHKPRIGLVWSGNPQHRNDHNRSLPLARLLVSLPVEALELVCLKNEVNPQERQLLQLLRAHQFADSLHDFADTAALASTLDLIISVDTSAAHLAGALGKPLWVLLPCVPDWRWQLERSDSPWYPQARLFRQQQIANWDAPLAELGQAMTVWLQDQGKQGQRRR
jgi:tetratricopeptide (TPR) repeat protein